MKTQNVILAVTVLIVISSVAVGAYYYIPSLSPTPTASPISSPTLFPTPTTTPVPNLSLSVYNLIAWSNGVVSFNVSLYGEQSWNGSVVLEEVTIQEVPDRSFHYTWSEGSSENATIRMDERRIWTVDVGWLGLHLLRVRVTARFSSGDGYVTGEETIGVRYYRIFPVFMMDLDTGFPLGEASVIQGGSLTVKVILRSLLTDRNITIPLDLVVSPKIVDSGQIVNPLTYSFDPNPVILGPGETKVSILTINARTDAPVREYTLLVKPQVEVGVSVAMGLTVTPTITPTPTLTPTQ